MPRPLFAFEVRVVDIPESGSVVNAWTRGQAKRFYLADLQDVRPDISWTDLRCRKVGSPISSERFLHNAKYRGVPGARCGDSVRTADGRISGVIVGHNDSANMDILTDEGVKLSAHPHYLIWDREVRDVA